MSLPADYTVSTAAAPASKYGVYTNTTDATPTTSWSMVTKPLSVYKVSVKVLGVNTSTDFTQAGDYWLESAFRTNAAGTLTQVGSTRSIHTANEDNAAWDAGITTSGTSIIVQVTGAAGTNITWLTNVEVVRATQYITAAGRIN